MIIGAGGHGLGVGRLVTARPGRIAKNRVPCPTLAWACTPSHRKHGHASVAMAPWHWQKSVAHPGMTKFATSGVKKRWRGRPAKPNAPAPVPVRDTLIWLRNLPVEACGDVEAQHVERRARRSRDGRGEPAQRKSGGRQTAAGGGRLRCCRDSDSSTAIRTPAEEGVGGDTLQCPIVLHTELELAHEQRAESRRWAAIEVVDCRPAPP